MSDRSWLQVKSYLLSGDSEVISVSFAAGFPCYSHKYSVYILHCSLSQVDCGYCATFVSVCYYWCVCEWMCISCRKNMAANHIVAPTLCPEQHGAGRPTCISGPLIYIRHYLGDAERGLFRRKFPWGAACSQLALILWSECRGDLSAWLGSYTLFPSLNR